MPTAKQWHEDYRVSTAKLGERTVQLSFACIAVVWIFKQDGQGVSILLPLSLRIALTLAVFALLADFSQYIVSALVRKRYADLADSKGLGGEEQSFATKKVLNRIEWFVYVKVAAVFFSYVSIGYFMIPRLFWAAPLSG